ncbi:MAG: Thioredoxin [Promethearchaeota archaeon]|nr:MAG: Thioredoxin [Candidatus Lokiarchaeota archaeon]
MSNENYINVIKREMRKLKKPVTLKVFTSSKETEGIKECFNCGEILSLLRIYEEHSNGMLTVEELSINKNLEFAKEYDIQRVPTILFIDEKGNEYIRYLAAPRGKEVQPFVQALFAFAGGNNYYENAIKQNLERIPPSTIKVMITMQCPYCPEVVKNANLFAIASKGKIRTVVVDIMANQDIGQYYSTEGVPYTIINENRPIQGMIGADQLLRTLIGGNINVQYR